VTLFFFCIINKGEYLATNYFNILMIVTNLITCLCRIGSA
jgi:hypothetical protein